MRNDAKSKAMAIFNNHLSLIDVDQTTFRKTVMQAIMVECNVSNASAATHYNNAKKVAEQRGMVVGLGRSGGPRKTAGGDGSIADNDCFTVLELIDNSVARTQSFITEDAARKKLNERLSGRNPSVWKLITGLGPNVGDTYKLEEGEIELA